MRNLFHVTLRGLLALFTLTLLTAVGHAQVSTGTILGSVTDASGAVLTGATVTAKNNNTGIATTAATNQSGYYSVPNLQPGDYSISVSAPGFSQEETASVNLDVGALREVNFALKVGGVDQKIEVTTAAVSVDLADSTIKPVVDQRTIVELPLNGRDWTQLAALQPGVAPARSQPALAISNQRANRGVGNQLTISGARPQTNNYRLDSVSINDYSNGGPGGVIGSVLGVDAIQEFSVVTSTPSADYGKTAGGVINAITRGGTNKFHGSVYEFFRNSALDARNPFDPLGIIPPFRRNQFGASIGGPIFRDRTFFFGDYEGLRQSQSISASSTVPSANARQGILCADADPACIKTTTVTVDPTVAQYLVFYPLPNGPVKGDTGLFNFTDPNVTSENFFTIRGDHKISNNDSLTGTYFYDNGTLNAPDPFGLRISGNIAKRQLATISESHTFAPTLVNSIHGGYSRVVSIAPTTLAGLIPQIGDAKFGFVPGLPVGLINIGGLSNFQGGLRATGEFDFHYNSYQIYDDLYWTLQKHSLKFGFAFERLQNNQLGTANPNGQYVFSNLRQFLTNNPASFNAPLNQGVSPRDLRQSVYGAYVQDDYRIRQNVTLNLGLRYEPASVPTETANRIAVLRNLTDPLPHLGSPYFNNNSYKNFSPRVGFAWDPYGHGTTAIRGGYGLYDALELNYLFEGLSIFTAPYLLTGNTAYSNNPDGSTTGHLLFPTGSFNQIAAAKSLRYSFTDHNPKRSYMQQYNLNVQQQLPWDMVAQIGYVGSKGTHLPYRLDDVNTVQPVLIQNNNYFFFGNNGSNKPLVGPRLNPNPGVGQISAVFFSGWSKYNSLQASLNKKFAHGVQAGASYTWSRSFDDGSSSTFGDTFINSVSSLPIWAPQRRKALSDFNVNNNVVVNWLYELPKTHSQNFASYFANGWQWGGIFQYSTGVPFTPLISGDPLRLNGSDNFGFPDRLTGNGCGGNPVNLQKKSYVKTQCFAFPTFDPVTGFTRLGNAGRNSIYGPNLADLDTAFTKNTRFTKVCEACNLQFRAEIFNLLNRSNYATPVKVGTQLFSAGGAPLSGQAGQLNATATTSRQTQFALKIIF